MKGVGMEKRIVVGKSGSSSLQIAEKNGKEKAVTQKHVSAAVGSNRLLTVPTDRQQFADNDWSAMK